MAISILFGIVCFREKYWDSTSFKNLVQSFYNSNICDEIYICIYDNTDLDDWDVTNCPHYDNVVINYYRDPLNTGISGAFNYFEKISQDMNFKWMVFLDQDTNLPMAFFQEYLKKSIDSNKDILFPKVFVGNRLLSPSYYNFYRTSNIKNLSNEIVLSNITAINSGLMIKTDFYLKNGGYNKNLRIDFCDHEFIERINNKNIQADIINISLFQEFSGNVNNKIKSLERYKLYVKDMKNYRKNKNKIIFFLRVDLPHLLKEMYRNKSLRFLNIRLNN